MSNLPTRDEPDKRSGADQQTGKNPEPVSLAGLIPHSGHAQHTPQSITPIYRESKAVSEGKAVDVKPMVDQFLKDTPLKEDKLNASQKSQVVSARDSVANSPSAQGTAANALHLANLYNQARCVEEAKKATMLALGIDPDNALARDLLGKLEQISPQDIAVVPMQYSSLTRSALARRIRALSSGRVIVLGDLLIDELLEGTPTRISREAPVLVLEHVHTEYVCGGAGNAAHNIAALGAACHAIGVCGADAYAAKLGQCLTLAGITHDLVADATRPTTVKTRILSGSHASKQQLLRLDRISHAPGSSSIQARIVEHLERQAPFYGTLLLSDYKGGVITDSVIAGCRRAAAEHKLILVADAQDGFHRFQQARVITPNQPDTEAAVGFEISSRDSLLAAGSKMLELSGSEAVLLTRGAHGIVLFEKGKEIIELPAFNRSEVFDVTGAGDTVAATMALAIATGASLLEAMAMANLAAGIVVKKHGAAVTSQEEMLAALEILQLPA